MRPPYGAYDDTTRTTARACGAEAVVTWTYDLTTWTDPVPVPRPKPGDIVLCASTGPWSGIRAGFWTRPRRPG
ncbi:hypothetical protein [Streptomyces spiralis]